MSEAVSRNEGQVTPLSSPVNCILDSLPATPVKLAWRGISTKTKMNYLGKKNPMRLPVTFPIVLCLLLVSCVKTPVDTNANATKDSKSYLQLSYRREDPTQSLTLKLYSNREDYYNDRNVVRVFTFPPGVDSLEVDFDSGITYYYDVFSDDRTMTNWAVWPYTNIYFKTAGPGRRYVISNNIGNIHRPLLLPGGAWSSQWVAVGSFTKLGNTWDTMSAGGRNKKIVFRRDQVAVYTDGGITREFRFGVSGNPIAKNAFAIKFYDTEDLDFIDHQYYQPYMTAKGPVSPEYKALNPNASNTGVVLPVTDTFYLTSEAFKHTFIMVREK